MTGLQIWWFRARHEWRLHYYLPILPLFPMAAYCTLPAQLRKGSDGQPVTARIKSFGPSENIQSPGWEGFRVYAETADGAGGTIEVSVRDIRGCAVGDSIEAYQSGVSLRLEPHPCT